ncbi:asparagine synthase B [Parashewanella spongiae]|uniref:asparagine synthase (glutamine-hydrolyzing) n=1 Tax=Parashewanella spongiae TaxID=342950 RepID=A0A3A6TRL1_9GAMM|nr:asparagine synthase B [Parashewanella spongiae]MCL1078279.1 asparagine synthase B [Parashewanella spongiae]RJY18775.1 asparagine synthase B [Parashewanella spongiae]
MCSIFGILDISTDVSKLRPKALELSSLLRHRGPDWSGIWCNDNAILVHERLAIVDLDNGSQPLFNYNRTNILAVNGEIYNHKALQESLNIDYSFQTQSDCEVILALYQQDGLNFIDKLQGMFAFILFDETNNSYLVARDHLGIIPLYYGHDTNGQLFVASEMKALVSVCRTVNEFPPGHYFSSLDGKFVPYYKRDWVKYDTVKGNSGTAKQIHDALSDSVKSHMMSDVPYGVLLSGGLDSSVISAIAQKYSQKRIEDNGQSNAWWPQLHSFAVGLKGSPDLVAAKKVSEFIGTVHHEIHFTVQEGIDAIKSVIFHLETYDVTTIRASTPMYLMARKIKAMGIKMVLSGEGADEIFGGYLYFHKAPNAKEFHEETIRKLNRLHMFDCARANKAMSAWGVEARVPFLDKAFIDVAMSINPEMKMCGNGKMEKHILREAFEGYLPDEVLWRQKEQFSDGVGYNWIDSLVEVAESSITDQMMKSAEFRFPHNTPDTKEGYYYRSIFEELFPLDSAIKCVPGGKSVACSTPEALAWDKKFAENADPSGRAMFDVHQEGYSDKSV